MTVLTYGGVAIAAAGTPALLGIPIGVGTATVGKLLASGPFSTIGGTLCGSATAGAIIGTAWTSSISGGVSCTTTATLSSLATALIASPLGGFIVGTDIVESSFDCWKAVVHAQSMEPSTGIKLRDLINDDRVSKVFAEENNLLLENIWGEMFLLELVQFGNELSFHARIM